MTLIFTIVNIRVIYFYNMKKMKIFLKRVRNKNKNPRAWLGGFGFYPPLGEGWWSFSSTEYLIKSSQNFKAWFKLFHFFLAHTVGANDFVAVFYATIEVMANKDAAEKYGSNYPYSYKRQVFHFCLLKFTSRFRHLHLCLFQSQMFWVDF